MFPGLALAAALVLAGCSSDSSTDEKAKDDKQAAASGPLTKETFGTRLGEAQKKAETGAMSMTVEAEGEKVVSTGEFRIDGDSAGAVSMTTEMGATGMGMEIIFLDQVLYMKMGELTQNKFLEVDLTDEDNPLGDEYGDLVDQTDPTKQLEILQDAVVSFEDAGDGGEIDGVSTTKYRVEVDTAKVLEAQGTSADDVAGSMPETVTYDLYVGDDDLLRRIAYDIAGAAMTVDYTNWGDEVSIEAPAKDQITDQDPFATPGS